jgi:hypothetical protein
LDEALEAELILQDSVEQLGVLTSIAGIDLVIRTHDTGHSSFDGIGKRPCVDLVQCAVIDVARDGVWKAPLPCLPEMLLFVADIMLRGSHDPLILYALDGLRGCDTL